MLYAMSDFTGRDWWALNERRYLLALKEAVGDLQILWRERVVIQPELVEVEFHPLLQHLGGSREPCTLGVYLGDVVGAVDYITKPESAAPKNIAIVTCPSDRIQGNLADPLSRFDAIVVPSEGARGSLLASGLAERKVHVVPIPEKPVWWSGADADMGSDNFTFYAIGEWDGLDNVQAVVKAYLGEFERKEETLLYVCCPDHPIRTASDLSDLASGRDASSLPFIACEESSNCLEGTSAYWRRKHLSGDCYASASRRLDLDPWVLDAAISGRPVVCSQRLIPWEYEIGGLDVFLYETEIGEADDLAGERGIGFGQKCGVVDVEELAATMRKAFNRGRRDGVITVSESNELGRVADKLAKVVADVVEDRVVEIRTEDRLEESILEGPSMAVVIPHRNRGVRYLDPCLLALKSQLRPGDYIIISDQESDESFIDEVREFCREQKISLVSSHYDGVWNLSRARNAGATLAETLGAELVFFLDCDVLIAPGYTEWARAFVGTKSVTFPTVAQGAEFLSGPEFMERGVPVAGEHRSASGLATIQIEHMDMANGYDETYRGWGYEDIDFFERLRASHGVEPILDTALVCYHQPHEESGDVVEFGKKNLDRVEAVRDGELTETVNPGGWRGGSVLIVEGEDQ